MTSTNGNTSIFLLAAVDVNVVVARSYGEEAIIGRVDKVLDTLGKEILLSLGIFVCLFTESATGTLLLLQTVKELGCRG